MTEHEAIKDIRENILPSVGGKSLIMAINALEKQIAKKPIVKQWCPAICPCCGCDLSESIGDGYYKHYTSLSICDCGQKLDWSEV